MPQNTDMDLVNLQPCQIVSLPKIGPTNAVGLVDDPDCTRDTSSLFNSSTIPAAVPTSETRPELRVILPLDHNMAIPIQSVANGSRISSWMTDTTSSCT
jgi:hypothetical protein